MKFKHTCPNCRTKDKMISRCGKCSKLICNICGIDFYCIDCYVKIKVEIENDFYFYDRYIIRNKVVV